LLSFSLLMACNSNAFDEDVLIEQSAEENLNLDIMNLLANQLGVWDITINNDSVEEIEIVVDHYQNGEKQEPILVMSTMFNQEASSNIIKLLIAEQVYEDESKWIAPIIDDGGTSSTENTIPNSEDFASKTYATAPVPDTVEIGEPFTIAAMMLSNSEDSIST